MNIIYIFQEITRDSEFWKMHIIFHAYSFTCTFVLESGYGFIGGVFCLFMLQQEGVLL